MRVVSMVPSWTETLIECGVDVVGRTRFCVHPADKVKLIHAVGGTKDVKWEKLNGLQPGLLVLDQEENPKSMAEESRWPVFASHIRKIEDVGRDLQKLGELLSNSRIKEIATRWNAVAAASPAACSLDALPGIVQWIHKPGPRHRRFVYLIWHNPWMAVSADTFIGSVLSKFAGVESMVTFETLYPQVDLSQFDPAETVLLFSTEPFPFEKKKNLIPPEFAAAVVDGAAYSWFGVRSLRFLETHLRIR